MIPRDLFLPISIMLGIVAYGLAARWYVVPWLRRAPARLTLPPLILPHILRYVGLAFLLHGVTAEPLDPRFADPAAWGDLLAALLALVAVLAMRGGWRGALGMVWVFNVVGSLDLLNAIRQGLRYTDDAWLGAAYFIPALLVPALLVTHALIFVLLVREARAGRLLTPARAEAS